MEKGNILKQFVNTCKKMVYNHNTNDLETYSCWNMHHIYIQIVILSTTPTGENFYCYAILMFEYIDHSCIFFFFEYGL